MLPASIGESNFAVINIDLFNFVPLLIYWRVTEKIRFEIFDLAYAKNLIFSQTKIWNSFRKITTKYYYSDTESPTGENTLTLNFCQFWKFYKKWQKMLIIFFH